MQAPQSTQTSALMTAMSPMVMAEEGHASAQAPHATQSASFTIGILVTSLTALTDRIFNIKVDRKTKFVLD
jgi:hypothetical protein